MRMLKINIRGGFILSVGEGVQEWLVMAIKRKWGFEIMLRKMQRGVRGVSVETAHNLPERNTAEDEGAGEAPEGKRCEEVTRLRRGGSGKGGERRTDDLRGSEVLCLRHGGRLREAGEDAQHGSILSQETLVHPPQGLDLSQSRESLHRGGQRYRVGQKETACRGGRPCAQQPNPLTRQACTHTPTQAGK